MSISWRLLPSWPRVLRLMLLGAASFWAPDTLLHVIRGNKFDSRDVRIVTLVMLLTFLLGLLAAKRSNRADSLPSLGCLMVVGIWLFGGLFMIAGWSFSGGGFAGPDGVSGGIKLALFSLFPPVTFMMATYDGGGIALLLVTAAAVIWLLQLSGLPRRLGHRPGPQKET